MGDVLAAIRDAIQRDERSQGQIARDAGIDAGQVSRLLRGERGVTATTLQRLAEALGYELKLVRIKRRQKR